MFSRLLILPVLLLLILTSQCKADDINPISLLQKIPALKQGCAFDVAEAKFNYITTAGIIKYNDFGISAGFSSDSKLVATLNYDIGGLKKLGIDTPITNIVDLSVGMYAGYGRLTGSNEFSWGPEVTVISVKF